MARRQFRLAAALFVCLAAGSATADGDKGDILKRGNLEWKDLLTDNATGPVTATAMLGMKGDAVRPVENLRDFVVSLEGLGTDGEKASFGIAVTPARTPLARPDLSRYDNPKNWPYRLLTATTFSYAQGNTTIEGADYARRAVAVETGYFLDSDDDPVIAANKAFREQTLGACKFGELFGSEPPPQPAGGAGAPPTPTPGTAVPKQDTAEALKKQQEAMQACADTVLKQLRWNRSYVSVSLATGWIKPAQASGAQRTLGRAAVVSLVYGFEDVAALRENAALTLAWRRTNDEPVLSTLGSGTVTTRDSQLVMARLAGGSSTLRGLIELSNARGQTTPSQRAFTHALGIDVRVQKGLWVGLRVGRQRTVDGTGSEVGSLLSISYSPTALLAN